VVVLERAFAVGVGGVVTADLAPALRADQRSYTVVAGLGGRPVTRASLRDVLGSAVADTLDPLTFLDLRPELIAPALEGA
jgi:pyruvate ferredoxin oxidoreductase alpha subunit